MRTFFIILCGLNVSTVIASTQQQEPLTPFATSSTLIKDSYTALKSEDQIMVQLAYLQHDMCFATHIAECKLQGIDLKVVIPINKFYGFASIGYLSSINDKNSAGRIPLIMVPAEIGIGKSYVINESLTSFFDLGYAFTDETEYFGNQENRNFNSGVRLKAFLEHAITDRFTIGVGAVHDRSQNASHVTQHGLKGKKEKMSFTNGELYASFKITPDINIKGRIIKMIQKPSDHHTSAASSDPSPQHFPATNYSLEFGYKFSK